MELKKSNVYVRQGLCHGVRYGRELSVFEHQFPKSIWTGTECWGPLCDGRRIIEADFNETRSEWSGAFDLVYSNAFDHVYDPEQTAQVWMDQVADGGRLLIEWSIWSNKLGTRGNRADCFAANLDEYVGIFSSVGSIDRVIADRGDAENGRCMIICHKPERENDG